MKKSIKAFLQNFGYTISQYNNVSEIENLLLKNSIPLEDVTIEGNVIFLQRIKLKINISEHFFVLRGYNFLLALAQKVKASFRLLDDDKIIAQINDHKVYINTWEEILILKEIYIDGIYNFGLEKDSNAIFFDIGMNVGFTSLFFAQKKEISKIYSFEPFPYTYNMALDNFKLNPDIISKISPYNWGLGKDTREEIWDYNPDYKGSMGMKGLPTHIYLDNSKNQKITILVKDVVDEFNRILKESEGEKIILKIDCEGAEYEIIESLFFSKLLEKFTCIMIEWHVKGPNELLRKLKDSGYCIFSFNEYDHTIGMIYAIKR